MEKNEITIEMMDAVASAKERLTQYLYVMDVMTDYFKIYSTDENVQEIQCAEYEKFVSMLDTLQLMVEASIRDLDKIDAK